MQGQLTLSLEDPRARRSLSRESEGDCWMSEVSSCSSTSELFVRFVRAGCCGRTSLEYFPSREEMLSTRSKGSWRNAGIRSRGELLTLNSPEWLSDAAASFLSDTLEWDVPQRYYSSAKACTGIARRAWQSDKPLPEILDDTLRMQAIRELLAVAESAGTASPIYALNRAMCKWLGLMLPELPPGGTCGASRGTSPGEPTSGVTERARPATCATRSTP